MSYPFHKKFNGDEVFFVADLHLQHKNLVKGESKWEDKSGCRDFPTVAHMNNEIMYSLQQTLNKDSILFILGDVLFGNKSNLKYWIKDIRCKEIHLIYGNHCDFIREDEESQRLFNSCSDYQEIYCRRRDGSYKLTCLFHYPIKRWRDCHKGSYALTGHVHGAYPYANNERGLDMDWNIHRKPLSFHEIDNILMKKMEN